MDQYEAQLGYTYESEIKTEGPDAECCVLHKGLFKAGREQYFLVLTQITASHISSLCQVSRMEAVRLLGLAEVCR